MRRPTAVFLLLLIAASCRRALPHGGAPPFDRDGFIAASLRGFLADNDIGAMAAHRGTIPETRQLGAVMHIQQKRLFDGLAAIAARKGVAVPAGIDEPHLGLKENLAILTGRSFDQAYALAMIQDLNRMARSFRVASSCGDADVENFAKQNLPTVIAEQKAAAALLDRAGGSPFGFVPQ